VEFCDRRQPELLAEFIELRGGSFVLFRALGGCLRKQSLEREFAVPGIEAAPGIGVVPIGHLDLSFQFVAFGLGMGDQVLEATEVSLVRASVLALQIS
jgi:hypothetical protein